MDKSIEESMEGHVELEAAALKIVLGEYNRDTHMGLRDALIKIGVDVKGAEKELRDKEQEQWSKDGW